MWYAVVDYIHLWIVHKIPSRSLFDRRILSKLVLYTMWEGVLRDLFRRIQASK